MEIKKYLPINKGCVIGAATIVIPEWGYIEIDSTLFQKGGNKWVTFASKSIQNKDGSSKFYNQVRFPKDVHERLSRAIFEKLEKDQAFKMHADEKEEQMEFPF